MLYVLIKITQKHFIASYTQDSLEQVMTLSPHISKLCNQIEWSCGCLGEHPPPDHDTESLDHILLRIVGLFPSSLGALGNVGWLSKSN